MWSASGVGGPKHRFSESVALVFGLLEALLTHGFPFAVGTGVCSPLSLNAFCLVT